MTVSLRADGDRPVGMHANLADQSLSSACQVVVESEGASLGVIRDVAHGAELIQHFAKQLASSRFAKPDPAMVCRGCGSGAATERVGRTGVRIAKRTRSFVDLAAQAGLRNHLAVAEGGVDTTTSEDSAAAAAGVAGGSGSAGVIRQTLEGAPLRGKNDIVPDGEEGMRRGTTAINSVGHGGKLRCRISSGLSNGVLLLAGIDVVDSSVEDRRP